jgi:hypothetical protein
MSMMHYYLCPVVVFNIKKLKMCNFHQLWSTDESYHRKFRWLGGGL